MRLCTADRRRAAGGRLVASIGLDRARSTARRTAGPSGPARGRTRAGRRGATQQYAEKRDQARPAPAGSPRHPSAPRARPPAALRAGTRPANGERQEHARRAGWRWPARPAAPADPPGAAGAGSTAPPTLSSRNSERVVAGAEEERGRPGHQEQQRPVAPADGRTRGWRTGAARPARRQQQRGWPAPAWRPGSGPARSSRATRTQQRVEREERVRVRPVRLCSRSSRCACSGRCPSGPTTSYRRPEVRPRAVGRPSTTGR